MPETLSCHPDFSTNAITGIDVTVDYPSAGKFILTYNVSGKVDQLALPESSRPERTDNLWETTCFEAFIGAPDDPGYLELNFSPSTRWAIYTFEMYREGMSNPELVVPPLIETSTTAGIFELAATLDLSGQPTMNAARLEIALTAVILEKNGRKSFWALGHPSGSPDFHNRDCFLHKLDTAESR